MGQGPKKLYNTITTATPRTDDKHDRSMDDDGLLLNFTTAPKQANAKQLPAKKPKGSWRERRDAKRNDEPLPAFKAVRQEKKPRGGVHKEEKPKAPKDGIVSSLFTYNPRVQRHDPEAESFDTETTNAPLYSSSFAVSDQLQQFLDVKMQLKTPTQIQSVALPSISSAMAKNDDVVMVAQTGSGKTLAYLLPLINKMMTSTDRIDRTSGVFALIMAPTRELASQIFNVCESLCRACHYIVPGLVIGGEKKKSEKARLRKGVNILIGTPGRLADHVDNTARLNFQKTNYVVLDEGDRLIDLGFEETLTKILAVIPQQRTTVLCSATMNSQASRLKTVALSDPIKWVREQKDSESTGAENTPGQLIQRVVIVPTKLRLVGLASKVRDLGRRSKRGIVFFSGTDSVDFHYHVFNTTKLAPVYRLHGGMNQQQRQQMMLQFEQSSGGVLLTTDVASRGLDISVDEVVEYDPPFTIEDHLHRVGRTARAGKRGEALMFLLPSEQEYESKLRQVHPGGLKHDSYQSLLQRGFGFSDWQDTATEWQLNVEKKVIDNVDGLGDLAKVAFTSHVRAYTTHSHAEKAIFNFRDLHLGHLAKAFALRETPRNISGNESKAPKPKPKSARQAMLDAAQKQLEMGDYNIA